MKRRPDEQSDDEAATATKAVKQGGTESEDRLKEKKRRTHMMNVSREMYQQVLQERQMRAAAAAQVAWESMQLRLRAQGRTL